MWVDHHRAVIAIDQGISVRVSACHDRRADVACRAWLVLDDHLLSKPFGQLVSNQSATRVGDAPGREGNNHADGLVGVGALRLNRSDRCSQADARSQGQQGEGFEDPVFE